MTLFLVFVLTFFAWTGVYPGGVPDAWQNAWQAAFAGYSTDPDTASVVPPFPKDAEPGLDFLLIFYVLLLIPALLITIACLALQFVGPAKLPPALYPLLPWRWGVVAALNLVLFLFLLLQLVFGFSLENTVIAAADKAVAARAAETRKGPKPDERSYRPRPRSSAGRHRARPGARGGQPNRLAGFGRALAHPGHRRRRPDVLHQPARRSRPPRIDLLW